MLHHKMDIFLSPFYVQHVSVCALFWKSTLENFCHTRNIQVVNFSLVHPSWVSFSSYYAFLTHIPFFSFLLSWKNSIRAPSTIFALRVVYHILGLIIKLSIQILWIYHSLTIFEIQNKSFLRIDLDFILFFINIKVWPISISFFAILFLLPLFRFAKIWSHTSQPSLQFLQ